MDMLSHAMMKYSPLVNDLYKSIQEKSKLGKIFGQIYRIDFYILGQIMGLNTDLKTIFILRSDLGFGDEDPKISYYGQ
jgi:hypothetical protein